MIGIAERNRNPMLANLPERVADGLLALMLAYRADARPNKLDLGIGVYRDERGDTAVLAAVKAAERFLVETQETKAYVGPDGDRDFVASLASIVFGAERASDERLVGVQSVGGTGALYLAAQLIAIAQPGGTVWLGQPTWPSHAPIFRAAGLNVRFHPFRDNATDTLDWAGMVAALEAARPGDVLLLHGCCHNPTGIAFAPAQWHAIADLVESRRIVPLVDFAYQGLGRGLDEDAAGMRHLFDRLESLIVTYSCAKNFGLYRERAGVLWVRGPTPASVPGIRSVALAAARTTWAMPPDHGAAVVRTVLQSSELTALWTNELAAMRARLTDLRTTLASTHPSLARLAEQSGIFTVLPLSADNIASLRREHAIYLLDDGRANLAGLQLDMIPAFSRTILPYLIGSRALKC